MWNGPIQDPEFVGKVLQHVESNEDKYGTVARMKGMLTVAKEVCHHLSGLKGLPTRLTIHLLS